MTSDVVKAHRCCTANCDQLKESALCGCFCCGRIYDPQEISEWVEDRDGLTALCPHCRIDAVIAEASGYPVTK